MQLSPLRAEGSGYTNIALDLSYSRMDSLEGIIEFTIYCVRNWCSCNLKNRRLRSDRGQLDWYTTRSRLSHFHGYVLRMLDSVNESEGAKERDNAGICRRADIDVFLALLCSD